MTMIYVPIRQSAKPKNVAKDSPEFADTTKIKVLVGLKMTVPTNMNKGHTEKTFS